MSIKYKSIFLMLLFVAGIHGISAQTAPQDTRFSDHYEILVERNIFSKNRQAYVEQKEKDPEPVRPPESFIVLKGIVKRSGEFSAYFENTQTGITFYQKKGEEILGKKIKKISINAITYGSEENFREIKIGQTLEGIMPAGSITLNALMQSELSNQSPSKTENNEDADILQKLKERRQKELGQ